MCLDGIDHCRQAVTRLQNALRSAGATESELAPLSAGSCGDLLFAVSTYLGHSVGNVRDSAAQARQCLQSCT